MCKILQIQSTHPQIKLYVGVNNQCVYLKIYTRYINNVHVSCKLVMSVFSLDRFQTDLSRAAFSKNVKMICKQ